MFYVLQRVETICRELAGLTYAARLNPDICRFKPGYFHDPPAALADGQPWLEWQPGDRWGGRDRHAWLQAVWHLPPEWRGKPVALYLTTDIEQGWDATNPQFLLFLNGEIVQGIDINHREALLAPAAQADQTLNVDLQVYGGMIGRPFEIRLELVQVDRLVRQVYYDLRVPLLVAQQLPEQDQRRINLLSTLNAAVNRLDLRKPRSQAFYASLAECSAYLQQEIYEKQPADEFAIRATCVGHTHIDVAWLWTIGQTRQKVARSFATVLHLMEQYPEYRFMSSQPQLYEFLQEDYPELFQRVRQRIAEGRWEAEGAMWLEADCNLISGESLVRQLLHGLRYFRREFGVENRVLWLPDVFGYSAALPQLLRQAGIDYFMTTKISWNQFNQLPYDTFLWRGLDGSEVLTHFVTTRPLDARPDSFSTTYNGELHPAPLIRGWERYQQKAINQDILVAFGHGDGGGGPTLEHLEQGRRMAAGVPGCPQVRMGSVADYFQRLEQKVADNRYLPRWVGELYLEYHRGTYTSMARNKRYNRKCELLYQDAEFLSVLAGLTGFAYPQESLHQGWKTILLNQFHDIIPGSSIEEVYTESQQQYEELLRQGKAIASAALESIAGQIALSQPAIVVYNTLSSPRSDLVTVPLPAEMKQPAVLDQQGQPIPAQTVESEQGRALLFLAPDVPAKGYQAYTLSEAAAPPPYNPIRVQPDLLENDFFRLELDEAGNIASLWDRRHQRQVLQPGRCGNVLQAFEDKPMRFDNWDIDIYYQEKMWEVDRLEEVTVLETGPVRGKLRLRKRFQDSVIVQDICIYSDIPRIDFETDVDWREDQVLLKVAFPVDVHADKATYDIQFGNVERPTHWNTSWDFARFEVCAHKWADLSEHGYGVSLLNDCKYGHDIKDGVMRLTLLKSGNYPNPNADRERHRFTYSLFPHAGDFRAGGTVAMAYRLNVPLYARLQPANAAGSLPAQFSLLAVDQENIILETVKRAEDSSEIIIRLHECYNQRTEVRISSALPIAAAWECNLLEEDLTELAVDTGIVCSFRPYEVKTIKLRW